MGQLTRNVWVFHNDKEVEVITPIRSRDLYSLLGIDSNIYDLWKDLGKRRDDLFINPNHGEHLLFKGDKLYSTLKNINQG